MTKGSIRRGCAQTHVMSLPEGIGSVGKVRVTYSQNRRPIIEKDVLISDAERSVSVHLTQRETLALRDGEAVEIQMKVLLLSGDVILSEIKRVECTRGLSEEVIA